MKKPISALCLGFSIFLLTGCSDQSLTQKTMNQSNYAILPEDSFSPFVPLTTQQYNPSEKDIQKTIEISEKFLVDRKEVYPLQEYKTQFVGFINENGEKNVWANYFCDSHKIDWRNTVIIVNDGGNCFFQLKVNLDENNVYDFRVNGEA